jgi:hypothetical protein
MQQRITRAPTGIRNLLPGIFLIVMIASQAFGALHLPTALVLILSFALFAGTTGYIGLLEYFRN